MAKPEKAFVTGEPCPELAKDVWRLYSMRFCPFAQRTRIVLAFKDIKYETVNVHLRKKPKWLVDKNPQGLVPVVERNGNIIYESSICDDYLDELYPDKPLYPRDPYLKARMKILMVFFDKVIKSTLTFYLTDEEEQKKISASNLRKYLQTYEEALQGNYFGGEALSMLDIHIWPVFERFQMTALKEYNITSGFPKLEAWVQRMREEPCVKVTLLPTSMHEEYRQSYLAGHANYDIGL